MHRMHAGTLLSSLAGEAAADLQYCAFIIHST